MTEQSKQPKKSISMKAAAIIALLGVIALCALFLLVALPFRALVTAAETPVPEVTLSPAPTPTPSPSPTPARPLRAYL